MFLPTKVRLVEAMVFPVVMYGYESWTIKKAELRRMDAGDRAVMFIVELMLSYCGAGEDS